MNKIKRKLKVLLFIMLGLTTVAISQNVIANSNNEILTEKDPNIFTEKVANNLFNKLKDLNQNGEVKNNPNILKNVVKEDVLKYSNIKYITASIFGQNFKLLTDDEKEKIYNGLEKYLQLTYGQIFTLYDKQQYELIPTSNINDVTKTQVVIKKEPPVKITFSLRKNSKTSQWQLFDITSEGVSFVETKRGEWAGKARNKEELNKLIEYLNNSEKTPIKLNQK